MNKYISLLLMNRLIEMELPYIEKYGGLVQTVNKVIPISDGKSVIKRIPVSAVHIIQDQNCDLTTKTLLHYVPESKLRGLQYFEDNGTTPDNTRRLSMLNMFKSRIRLVVWLNSKKNTEYNFDYARTAQMEMINGLVNKKYNNSILKLVKVEVTAIPINNSSLFPYDYEADKLQFLTTPYDFFAVDFEVSYGVPKNCRVPYYPIYGRDCENSEFGLQFPYLLPHLLTNF